MSLGLSRILMWIPLLQVVQSVVTVYLWRGIGRRMGSKGSRVPEDPDHTHLDPIHQEHMDDTLKNDGFIELQKNT